MKDPDSKLWLQKEHTLCGTFTLCLAKFKMDFTNTKKNHLYFLETQGLLATATNIYLDKYPDSLSIYQIQNYWHCSYRVFPPVRASSTGEFWLALICIIDDLCALI